jgi:hypothetical protein
MKKSIFAASALALGLAASALSLPARADSGDIFLNKIFAMADQNKDSMVSKEEFLKAMGDAYDLKMAQYKKDGASKMMKGDLMTKDGLKDLLGDIYRGT